jgi:hypothetical protein
VGGHSRAAEGARQALSEPSVLTSHRLAGLEALLEPVLDALADKIVSRLTAGTRADMVDQAMSPLGRRRHIAACRSRVARGEAGAAIVGRRHLLSRDALRAELDAVAKRVPRKRVAAPPIDELAELREELGLERIRKG